MVEKLIYDLGFHKGEDTPYYLSKGFKVVAVEANPALIKKKIKKLGKFIQSGQLILLNKGISHHKGNFTFWINDKHSEWSSFIKHLACRHNTPCHSVEVECNELSDLFSTYGVPYYLKIDVEGYDIFCVEQINPDDKPRFVSCESSEILLELLRDKGYSKFKVINNYDGFNALDIETERKFLRAYKLYFRWYFFKAFPFLTKHPMGASGPLPEETSGEWLSYEKAAELYEDWKEFLTKENKGFIKNLSWIDFHATW